MKKLSKTFLSYFDWAIKDGLINFELDPMAHGIGLSADYWLVVSYKNNQDGEGKNWKWKFLCAQPLSHYKNTKELVNRVNLMLADGLRSRNQDVNIIYQDYNLVRK